MISGRHVQAIASQCQYPAVSGSVNACLMLKQSQHCAFLFPKGMQEKGQGVTYSKEKLYLYLLSTLLE